MKGSACLLKLRGLDELALHFRVITRHLSEEEQVDICPIDIMLDVGDQGQLDENGLNHIDNGGREKLMITKPSKFYYPLPILFNSVF